MAAALDMPAVAHVEPAQHREQLLTDELNHRVKNMLAVVQSIAAMTLRDEVPPSVAREAFTSRLMALAAAHDVLAAERWEGGGLEEVLATATCLHDEPDRRLRISLRGPAVRLNPKAAVAISMAFNELATNAVRYGALSDGAGRVAIDWSVTERDGGQRLRLSWTERGGPPVAPPTRKGFGSRLIERGLPGELNGTVSLAFPPDGVVCVIDAPLPSPTAGV